MQSAESRPRIPSSGNHHWPPTPHPVLHASGPVTDTRQYPGTGGAGSANSNAMRVAFLSQGYFSAADLDDASIF